MTCDFGVCELTPVGFRPGRNGQFSFFLGMKFKPRVKCTAGIIRMEHAEFQVLRSAIELMLKTMEFIGGISQVFMVDICLALKMRDSVGNCYGKFSQILVLPDLSKSNCGIHNPDSSTERSRTAENGVVLAAHVSIVCHRFPISYEGIDCQRNYHAGT